MFNPCSCCIGEFGGNPSWRDPFQRGVERVGKMMIAVPPAVIIEGNAPFGGCHAADLSEDAPLSRARFAAR